MINNRTFISIAFLGFYFFLSFLSRDEQVVFAPAEDGVAKVMKELGYNNINHFPDLSIKGVSAKAGEEIIKYGFTNRPGGRKTKKQSKHFVCTSCHNLEREDPNLSNVDPQGRLEYTHKNGLPFLQGTTLWGAVNRESFYNDDYEKKYGKLVEKARNDIRGAIQLCAVECAQGRKLKKWEIESILAYMWTLELKMSDLDLAADEKELVNTALDMYSKRDEAVTLLKSKYLQRSPAHFIDPPADRKLGTYSVSSADNGKLIYENSCLHCHENQRYSFLNLDNSKLSFRYLKKNAPKYNRHSIYQVIRYGVQSKSGKQSYMPHYPVERMEVQQLDDLRLYIEKMAD